MIALKQVYRLTHYTIPIFGFLALITLGVGLYRGLYCAPADYQSGALDHLILSKHPLAVLCFAKMLAHMLAIGLPLLLVAPVVAVLFHFNRAAVVALAFSLLLGIPTISLIASVGAALTLGLERGAWLVMLLILPLLLPLILLGVHAVMCAAQGLAWQADILLLSALFIFSLVAVPLLMAFTLRVSLE